MSDELGTVDDAETEAETEADTDSDKDVEDDDALVVIGSTTVELLPVSRGIELDPVPAGQKPLSQEVYWIVSLAAQL